MRTKILTVGAAVAVLASLEVAAAPQYIPHATPPGAPALPFSDAVMVGDVLYVGGHIGIDPKTGQAVAGVPEEAKAVIEDVQATLKAAGLTLGDLVSVTVYCTDLSLYDTFNKVYSSYFHAPYPARAFIGVASLVRGGHFEIQGIAVRPAKTP